MPKGSFDSYYIHVLLISLQCTEVLENDGILLTTYRDYHEGSSVVMLTTLQ